MVTAELQKMKKNSHFDHFPRPGEIGLYMSMTLKSKVTQSIKSVSYWQGHWLSCPGPSLWKWSVSTDHNLSIYYVAQKVFLSSTINPSHNPGFIQAAKEFFEKFKDCANVILGKESTANKQWTREKYFYTERTSFILLYFYSKNHLQPKHNTRRCARTNIPQSERLLFSTLREISSFFNFFLPTNAKHPLVKCKTISHFLMYLKLYLSNILFLKRKQYLIEDYY